MSTSTDRQRVPAEQPNGVGRSPRLFAARVETTNGPESDAWTAGREPFEQMALDSSSNVLGDCRMFDETPDLAAYIGHDISPLCSGT